METAIEELVRMLAQQADQAQPMYDTGDLDSLVALPPVDMLRHMSICAERQRNTVLAQNRHPRLHTLESLEAFTRTVSSKSAVGTEGDVE